MRQKSQQTKWWERFSSWWLSGVRCVSPHGVFALLLLQLQYLIKLLDTLPFAQVLFSILLLPFHFCIPTDLPLWVDITLHKLCVDSAFIFKTLNCISYFCILCIQCVVLCVWRIAPLSGNLLCSSALYLCAKANSSVIYSHLCYIVLTLHKLYTESLLCTFVFCTFCI